MWKFIYKSSNCKLLNKYPQKVLKENAKVVYSMRYLEQLEIIIAG